MRHIGSLFVVVVFSICVLQGQNKDIHYAIKTSVGLSSTDNLPFWLAVNQYGSVPDTDYTSLNTSLFKAFDTPDKPFDIAYKISTTSFIAQENRLFVNELYLSMRYKHIILDLGAKNDAILWSNLSSSNGSIIKSINARAMPGINIKTNTFIPLPFAKKWLKVKGNFAHYFMNDTRAVSNTNLHHKSFYIKTSLSPAFKIVAGIEHYVQWGGTSPQFGPQPSAFNDYIKIVFGAEGGNNAVDTDQINALGNHVGAYLLKFNYNGKKTNLNFYYSHPFEDTSGRELTNWQDGLYGVFIDFKKEKALITHLLTEFTYTKHMSNIPVSRSGPDSYFNNIIYRSGWTYHGNTIGSPYFMPKPVDENGITNGVILGDSRFAAFNIGVSGYINEIPYKAMLSHTTYFGWFDREYKPNPILISGILDLVIPQAVFNLPFEVSTSFAFDTGTYRSSRFGAFLSIKKTGVF